MHTSVYASLLFLLPTCASSLLFAQNTAQPLVDPSRLDRWFVLEHIPQTFALADSFIIIDSETVRLGDALLSKPGDYTIDYFAATLTVNTDSARAGDTLFVAYRRLPLPLKAEYANRVLRQAPPDSGAGGPRLTQVRGDGRGYRRTAILPESADLRKSGSLVRGVSVGSNQGLRVDSGLRLQLSGNITDDLEITAALTDQNTPIQPEGSTQTLQEIDKVFIKLTGKQFEATLGDYELEFSGTEFAQYRRKLQGASAALHLQPARLSLFGAVSKGKFRSMQVLGVEGKQGPYQLTGDRGQIDIIVLAGTERVWIDGEPMVRGENNDYVIEYGNGQITFTRRRLITGDSRITVDFQFSDNRFQRSLFGAEASVAALDNKLQVRTTLLRDGDDKDNPLGFPLTDELRRLLESAGDSAAVVDGATFVGDRRGDYRKDDGIFVYVGQDSGDYKVVFSDVGDGLGSYRYAGFGRYIFVGQGDGRYEPVVLLPKAQRNEIADVRLDFQPATSIRLTSEVALSRFDRNLYSSSGATQDAGGAYLAELQLAPEKLAIGGTGLGRAWLNLRYRHRAEQYRNIDRDDVIEFGRKWDLGSSESQTDETIAEGELRLEPWRAMQFYGTAGTLQRRASDFESARWELGTRWTRPDIANLTYRLENIQRQAAPGLAGTDWLRQRGSINRLVWGFRPLFEIESELRKEEPADSLRSGFRFAQYTAGLGLEKWRHLRAEARFSTRDDDDRAGERFLPRSQARTQSYTMALQEWRNVNIAASYIHRERDFASDSIPDSRSDLAEIKAAYQPWRRALQLDGQYQVSNTAVNQLERVFFRVAEGEGNYRFDEGLNEYVPDAFGDHILRLVPTDDFIPVVELRSRLLMRIRPGQSWRPAGSAPGWQRLLAALSAESLLRIEEKTRDPEVRDIFLFNLSRYQNPDFTLFGTISLRQDVHLYENRRDFSLRYRLLTSRSLNNQFLEGAQRQRQIRHELRLNLALSRRVAGQFELVRSIEDRQFAQAGRVDRFVRGLRLVNDLSYRPQPRLELALRSIVGRDFDRAHNPATEVRQLSLLPRTVLAFSGKGQLRAEFDFTRVSATPAGRIIPFELAQGNRVGTTWRWNLDFTYRVSRNLNATLSYQGRDEPDRRRTLHLAKAEMRAFF